MLSNIEVKGPLAWALASFHATTLVLLGIAYLYQSDDLTGLLNGDERGDGGTIVGLAAFAALWFASFLGTLQMLPLRLPQDLSFANVIDLVGRGAVGGAISGGAFLLMVAIAIAPVAAYEAISAGNPLQIFPILLLLLVVAAIGSFFAAALGAIGGLIAGAVDTLLLAFALKVIGPLPLPQVPDTEMPAT